MFLYVGAILKATNSSFQNGMPVCRSIYVKKVMKLLAFIFEQPSYLITLLVYVNNETNSVKSFLNAECSYRSSLIWIHTVYWRRKQTAFVVIDALRFNNQDRHSRAILIK